mmetsp:Transcript_85570/g.245697  ORF Transcript_85570/g.245697 Transcript_85570/m.245697 type:complete len:120 (-) Transcript_85570:220-579(-)
MDVAWALTLGQACCWLSALEHVFIMHLETVMWRTRARKVVGTTDTVADSSAPVAAQLGMHNGFLGFGLFYSQITGKHDYAFLFLGGVLAMAAFGTTSFKTKIIITLIALCWSSGAWRWA